MLKRLLKRDFERGPYYFGLLQRMGGVEYKDGEYKKTKNPPRVRELNIAFPGTGGGAESPFAHRQIMRQIENEKAIITFAGIGAKWDSQNPNMSVQAPSHSIESHEQGVKSKYSRKWGDIFAAEKLKGISGTGDGTIPRYGALLFGYGLKSSVETVINMLLAMKEDGCLPTTLCLGGHSRGAVASIVLANRIWEVFGTEIKINIAITDPVPGPEVKDDFRKYVIPPNVETFTVAYATSGMEEDPRTDKHIKPLDPKKFKIANPRTQVTCVGIPGTSHASINQDRSALEILNTAIQSANGKETSAPRKFQYSTEDKTGDMMGRAAREGINYYRVEGPSRNEAIREMRENVISGYKEPPKLDDQADFLVDYRKQDLTSRERCNESKKLFGGKQISRPAISEYPKCTGAHNKLCEVREKILSGIKQAKDGNYQCNIGSFLAFSNKKFVTKFQKKCLDYINMTNKKANYDPYSPLWKEAVIHLQKMWEKEIQVMEKNEKHANLPKNDGSASIKDKLNTEEYKFIASIIDKPDVAPSLRAA